MATCTWTNGASTALWNNAGNWSCAQVPTSSDAVVFDATSTDNCTLNVDAQSLASIDVQSGYSGTLDFADSSYEITISGDVTFAGSGTVDPGNVTFNVGGSVDVTAQTTMTQTSTHSWVLSGSGETLNSASGARIANVTIADGASYTYSATGIGYTYGNWTIDGTLTLSSAPFPLTSTSTFTVNGTVDGTQQIKNWKTTVVNNGGTIGGSVVIWSINGSTLTVNSGGAIDTASVYNIFEGSVTVNGDAPWTFTGSGEMLFRGEASARTLTFGQNVTFDIETNITHTGAGTYTIAPSGYDVTFRKDLNYTATGPVVWSKGSGTITLSAAAGVTNTVDFDGETIEDLVIGESGRTGTVELTGPFVTDSLTCAYGTLDVNAQDITVSGAMTVAAGCTVLE